MAPAASNPWTTRDGGGGARSAAEDSERAQTKKDTCESGTSRPTFPPSGLSTRSLATSLAPQLHGAVVAEGGRVWSAPVLPSQTQTGRKRTKIWLPNGSFGGVVRRWDALPNPRTST